MPRKILILVSITLTMNLSRVVVLSGGVVMSSALSTISTSAENLNMIPNPKWTLESFEKGERDYKENKALNAMVNLSLLADWYLTSEGLKNTNRPEVNPILGKSPNQSQLNIYFLGSLLYNALLPKVLGPKYADIIRAQDLAGQIRAIESWLKPTYDWSEIPLYEYKIPFKF